MGFITADAYEGADAGADDEFDEVVEEANLELLVLEGAPRRVIVNDSGDVGRVVTPCC